MYYHYSCLSKLYFQAAKVKLIVFYPTTRFFLYIFKLDYGLSGILKYYNFRQPKYHLNTTLDFYIISRRRPGTDPEGAGLGPALNFQRRQNSFDFGHFPIQIIN